MPGGEPLLAVRGLEVVAEFAPEQAPDIYFASETAEEFEDF